MNTTNDLHSPAQRILVVSNRGPFEYQFADDGRVLSIPGQGGVATALRLASDYGRTTWFSSPLGAADRYVSQVMSAYEVKGASRQFVDVDDATYKLFYDVFANEVLWFLQHEMEWPAHQTAEQRREAWEDGYLPVNQAFAEAISRSLGEMDGTAVMLHDYHFYAAPLFIRNMRPGVYLQQFVHIPWPQPAVWSRLDAGMVVSICRSLLANDSLVFQTPASAQAFLATAASYLPDVEVDESTGTTWDGLRTTRVLANPISVDPEELAQLGESPDFARYQRELAPLTAQKLIVRVDRLDPSKNVLAGFQAFRHLLLRHPELCGEVQMLAFLVPTRSTVPAYQDYQRRTLALVDEINADFGIEGWQPITVKFENNRLQALAGLSLADVILVNPLADGMNLVSKEGPLVNDRDAVLVLSKRAGSYGELSGSVLGIDPEDVSATSGALLTALSMPQPERQQRATTLKARIISHDLRTWFASLIAEIAPMGVSAPATDEALLAS